MTKAQFEALRDNNLGDTAPSSPSTPLRDPVCDRTTYNAVIAEFFAAQIEDTKVTNNVATVIGVGYNYNLIICKKGNKVDFNVNVENVSGSALVNASVSIFKITNTLFIPKETIIGTDVYAGVVFPFVGNECCGVIQNTNNSFKGTFAIIGSLPINSIISIRGHYFTND